MLRLLLLALALTCGCGSPPDDAARRQQESARLEGARRGVKVGCYAALKSALRSLPGFRIDVDWLGAPKSRDEWQAIVARLAETDPNMKPWVSRPGMFAVAASLAGVAEVKGRDFLVGEPFGSGNVRALNLASEIKSLLLEDEDAFPGLFAGILSGVPGRIGDLANRKYKQPPVDPTERPPAVGSPPGRAARCSGQRVNGPQPPTKREVLQCRHVRGYGEQHPPPSAGERDRLTRAEFERRYDASSDIPHALSRMQGKPHQLTALATRCGERQ